jgi:hypothetical protein
MHLNRATRKAVASCLLGAAGALTLVACGGGGGGSGSGYSGSAAANPMAGQTSTGFADTALVSDQSRGSRYSDHHRRQLV